MPPFQAAALDKVLAGMESAAMAYVSYPASKALGKVLLQTAPENDGNQLNGLKRAVKIVSGQVLKTQEDLFDAPSTFSDFTDVPTFRISELIYLFNRSKNIL